MSIKDVLLIRSYTDKEGNEKTSWERVGVCFGTNKDGSMNFELHLFPNLKFQIRERREKTEKPKEETPF
jgi:hypothetical protein